MRANRFFVVFFVSVLVLSTFAVFAADNSAVLTQVQELIKVLEPLAAPDLPLLLPYDPDGNPYFQEACDARDTAQGLRLMLDRPEANGEVFNLTPPTVVNMAEFIPYMAKKTGRRYVEAKLPFGFPRIQASSAKARCILGYCPQHTLFSMVDEALALKAGQK